MKWPQTFISIHLLLTAAEQLQNSCRTFILLICGCKTFVSTICNHLNFLHFDWSILNGVQTFISAAEDIFILANQRPPFFAATRPLVSGIVRSGTLPPWSRDVARIAFAPGPAGSSNLHVPILSAG